MAAVGVAILLAGTGAWLVAMRSGEEPAKPASPRKAPPSAAAPVRDPAPLPPPAGTFELNGVVLRDGKPAAARVTAWIARSDILPEGTTDAAHWERLPAAGCMPVPRGTADAGPDGKFSLRGLAEGTYRLEAVAPDGARGHATDWTVEGSEPAEITLLPGTCTLRGRALRPGGAPWTGPLSLHDSEYLHDLPAPLVPDAEGRFRVEGLPEREVRLLAAVPGRCLVFGPTVVLPCDEEVVFVVGEGWSDLPGTVVADADGSPVAGAVVRARYGEEGDEGHAEMRSGADGSFLLAVPRDAAVELEVEAAGFAPMARTTDSASPPDLAFRLLRFASLSGRVLDADGGTPVAGVKVMLLPGPWGCDPDEGFQAASGPDGRFAFEGVPPGPAQILALGGGRISREAAAAGGWAMEGNVLRLEPGAARERDVAVVPIPRARGRVVDADGAPVAGAAVEAVKPGVYEGNAQWILWNLDPSTAGATTGTDGTFTFPVLMPGLDYGFIASRDGHRLASAGPYRAETGREIETLLALPAERFVTVRVLEEEGAGPVAGAVVEVNALLLPGENLDLPGEWRTGEDGTVLVGPLPEAALTLRARAEPGSPSSSESSSLADGDAGPVELRIPGAWEPPPPLIVEGVVLLPDGSPAAGARITLWSSPWGCISYEFLDPPRADYRGRFRVEASGSSVNLEAVLVRGGKTFGAMVTRDAEEGASVIRDMEVRLLEAGREESGLDEEGERPRLTVRVVGPAGAAVARGEANFHFLDAEGGLESVDRLLHEGRAAARIPEGHDADRVWIEVVPVPDESGRMPGFGHGLHGPWPVPTGDTEVEIRAAAPLSVRGRVVDPEGRGVAGVELAASPYFPEFGEDRGESGGTFARTESDASGGFLVEGLGDREYFVTVEPPRSWAPAEGVRVRPGETAPDVRLHPSVAAVLTVVDESGARIAGALVDLRSVHGDDSHGVTDAEGKLRIDGLDPSIPHGLRVQGPKEREDLGTVDIPIPSPVDMTVTLPTRYRLEVTVRDPAGRPLEGIHVAWEATAEPGAWRSESTDSAGLARFRDLPEGEIRIEASLPGAGGSRRPGASVVVSTALGKADLVLDPGGTAVLRVAGAEGENLLLASFAREEDLEPIQEGAGEDGRIHLRGLAPGAAYNVYLRDLDSDRCALLRGVRAGDREREVVLVPGRPITGKVLLPEGADTFSVALLVGKTVLIDGRPGEGGAFEFPAVPEGTWTVVAYLTTEDGKYHAATATVQAGASVDLRVK